MDLSVVIPLYNARCIVENSVRRLTSVLDDRHLDYEILLRDDGSADGTKDLLEGISKTFPAVRWSQNPVNSGLGATLRALWQEAKGKYIIYCDCDLPFSEKIISILWEEIQDSDIVVTSRYKGGMQSYVRPLRRLTSRIYYILCKGLFHTTVSDLGSGSVAIRKDALRKLELKAKGFDIHIEFYVKAQRAGLFIKEIAAEAVEGREGSFCLWKHGPRVVWQTLRLRWDL